MLCYNIGMWVIKIVPCLFVIKTSRIDHKEVQEIMRTYEIMYVVRPNMEDDAVKSSCRTL